MRPVVGIRNDRDDTLGITAAVLGEAGIPFVRFDAFEADGGWPDLEEIGGLMVFGGEMNADETDRHPQLLSQRALMRRAVDAGLPVLGIAFQTGDRVFPWHEDTFDLPAGADLLAAGDDVPNQAFRIDRNAWAVQFHFEVDADGVEAWLRVAEPTLSRVWKRTAGEVREELRMNLDAQQHRSRALLAGFAGQVRSRGLDGQVAE